MVDPVFIFALATAVLGLWELGTGSPLLGAKRWSLSQRVTRWYGAYTLTGSLVVVVLAVTYSSGVAFITFGLLALFMTGTIQVVQSRRGTL